MSNILDYYKDKGVSIQTLILINRKLKLPTERLTPFARPRRIEALNEALKWKKGPDQEHRIIKELYHIREYVVAIAKPGKEAAPSYRGCRYYTGERKGEKTNNPNDMLPFVMKSGKKIGKNLTFGGMFERIEKLMHEDMFGLEILGMLIFRAAFMLDHKKDKNGNWRYQPPEEVMKIIEKRLPHISEFPIRVFIHFLEVLSLNEDIKVHTLGYVNLPGDYGRINTLLTFAHLITVFLNRRSIAAFAGSFARPPSGMAPMPKTKGAIECFPLLSPQLNLKE